MMIGHKTLTHMPWVQDLPRDWFICRLSNIADVVFSNVDKHTNEGELPVRLCNYTDVYNNATIVADMNFMRATALPKEIQRFQLKQGDILATKDSEAWDDIAIASRVVRDMPDVLCGYHLAIIRPRSNRIASEYLGWLYQSKPFRGQYETKAVGITRFGLGKAAFRETLVPLPPRTYQYRISVYLDHACKVIDEAIVAKQKQLDTLAQLRKSIMHQVVTRGLDDSVVLKDSGVGWVGRIPVHWHVVWLKNVAAVNALSLGADTDSAHEFNYLEISNVNCLGVIDPSAIKKVRFGDAPSRARRIVCDGDILISSVRPNLQGAAFFERAPADLVCSTGFNVVRPDEKKFWPKFLYYVLTSSYAWQYFEAMTTGANYPAIAEKYFLKLVFPFPPKLEQNSIVRYLDRVCHGFVELNMKLTSQIAALYDYRKSLIHECVTGKRRITAADIQKVKGDV